MGLDIFPSKHFRAILFRRWTMVKRSLRSVIISIVGTLIFSVLAIALQWLMVSMMKPKHMPTDFAVYLTEPDDLIYIGDKSDSFVDSVQSKIEKLYHEDTGITPNVVKYASSEKFQTDLYENLSESHFEYLVPFVIDYVENSAPYEMMIMYNSTTFSMSGSTDTQLFYSLVNVNRALWKYQFGDEASFTYKTSKLLKRLSQRIFGQLGPMLIACGLISIVPLIISQPITDICGEVRQYMVSCTLKIMPYWTATFLIDICIWVIVTTVVWAVFNAAQITSFHDNLFNSWYTLVFVGPSFLLFIYCFSFCFSSPESAARQAFMILIVILLVPVIVSIVRDSENPVWLDWIYSLFPHISIQQLLGIILTNMSNQKQPFSYYWKEPHAQIYLIMQWIDIIIYIIILTIIEMTRLSLQRKSAKRSFGDYHEFFKNAKSKHPVTQEAHDMEKEVKNNSDYAVRIDEVSRLFINTAGEPIPAVNCVSLGVKEGSLFGFLGANGAGKTTLIKMITGMLPPSDGSIEILGTKIENLEDPTVISICPQFNNHLCQELTSREHFKLYSLLFRMNPSDTKKNTENLIKVLELEELADKPLRELSGGDVRKLAIALSFLGPAKIILLDEPTASLDPVARHHVHDMILEFKGQKTFMLCTHLLSEAESLCDNISIMIKGNVYTVGSPQYLTQKFGTEFKIDVMLTDDSDETGTKCDEFFATELPTAVLSIKRPTARIYSIPASDTTLPVLFKKMQQGSDQDAGFSYYTCSSSSLERVFMEIVHMSENDDAEFHGAPNDGNDKKEESDDNTAVRTKSVSPQIAHDIENESSSQKVHSPEPTSKSSSRSSPKARPRASDSLPSSASIESLSDQDISSS
ncbi:ABC transporter family protein [Tritrichomonas foetus]|uniref:ABC transporter family protein n=1 Tax=Tritrichomonas foetus TaxID=1144522 RepID=A0A1J4K1M6_9EUKA|nr:ABC transporter family protein [Tritrichomonas foetus]|eukprot:OHT05139.1 ABC transporter family protein [Tritrichomonas foetus]